MLWYPPELSSLNTRARQSAMGENVTDLSNAPERLLNVVLGSELLSSQKTTASNMPATIETGCTKFNEILRGRIRPSLILLAGQDDVIVTMLSLYISIGYLVQCEGSVSIIDTAGSFDVVRMLSVVKYRLGLSMSKDISAQEIAVLDRVHISRVFDIEGLDQIVSELETQLINIEMVDNLAPNIITIGNIANMFSTEITKNRSQGHARLEKLCLRLRRLAVQHQVVFLLLNTVTNITAHGELTLPPPFGRTFADLIDVSMRISRPENIRSQDGGTSEPVYSLAILEDQSVFDEKIEALFQIRDGNQLEFFP